MSIWTLLAAMVASGTALWIAYKVYPHQKELDRRLQMRSEKRETIVEYFIALQDFVDSYNKPHRSDMDETQARLETSARRLLLFIDEAELAKLRDSYYTAKKFADAVKKWTVFKEKGDEENSASCHKMRQGAWGKFNSARDEFLAITRKEFFPGDSSDSKKIIADFARKTLENGDYAKDTS